MKILIVDDEQWRHDLYNKVYSGNEVVSVYSSDAAIEKLKE
jgi:CheY-like chemotaxis protein